VSDVLAAKRRRAQDVLDLVQDEADVIVGALNGEPKTVLDAIEAGAGSIRDLRLHQMLPLRDRAYFRGEVHGLRHVSWFLSGLLRQPFADGTVDLVPASFSDIPHLMRQRARSPLVVTAASPPDPHGFFSLGCNAEYAASFIGDMPFFVEANARCPRTNGENQIHVSQVEGWCEAEYDLVEAESRPTRDTDRRIAELVAERIPDGATLQAGIGAIPNEVLKLLTDHRHLGIHTELMSDGVVDLVEAGAVTGTRKRHHRNKVITTSAFGSQRLYDFVADNAGVEFWPVDHTNDPTVICREPDFRAINATVEVDFLGQCASESLGTQQWSSSGGQPDFARGSLYSPGGRSFIVLHSTTADETQSRIVSRLHPGAAVTTFKNLVDCVVTEHGVAELRGSSIAERTRRLIAIAHPRFRDDLEREAREIGYL
jgi:acyl-CoA hydrolase